MTGHGSYLVQAEDGLDQSEPLYKVPLELFAENRQRLLSKLHASGVTDGVVFHKGGKHPEFECTDGHKVAFRQESFFFWLFGTVEPDCHGLIDIKSGKSVLFVPRFPPEFSVWMGEIHDLQHFTVKYRVDETHYNDEIADVVKQLSASKVYVLHGQNTDSGSFTQPGTFAGIENYSVDNCTLYPVLVDCRVVKSQKELDLLRYVNRISCRAHLKLMQTMRPGLGEHQSESLFLHSCYTDGGCRHMSYGCIGASGANGAILHYPYNSMAIRDGALCLFDMGGEYLCYGSDVTRTFPANGKFTQVQREVYEAVEAAQAAVFKAIKPGVLYYDMHRLANQVLCEKLLAAGFLQGSLEDIMTANVAAIFQPHGLGHFLGLDVHDVGGYPPGTTRPTEPGFCKLRIGRPLAEGMFLTVEPGCYFNPAILEPALKDEKYAPFLVEQKIRDCLGFGGVRIEDDVIVTADGCENVTCLPTSVADIEAVMAGAPWEMKVTTYKNC